MYLHLGFSVNAMMPNAYGDRTMLTPTLHANYKNALPDAASRVATLAFVKEIKDAGAFWDGQWKRVEHLRRIPCLLGWGLKDRFFPIDRSVGT